MVDEETRNLYASPKPNLKGTKVLDTDFKQNLIAYKKKNNIKNFGHKDYLNFLKIQYPEKYEQERDLATGQAPISAAGDVALLGISAYAAKNPLKIATTLIGAPTNIPELQLDLISGGKTIGLRGKERLAKFALPGIKKGFQTVTENVSNALGSIQPSFITPEGVRVNQNMMASTARGGAGTGRKVKTLSKSDGLSTRAYESYVAKKASGMKEGTEAWHSFVSTPPGKFRIQGRELVFNRSAYKIKELTQHHEVQKAVSSRITQKMRQFVGGDPELLHYMDEIFDVPKRFGLEAGSGRGAIKDMPKPVHTIHHGRAQRGTPTTRMKELGYKPGLQPSGDHLKQLYNEIDNVKSPEDLIALYEDFIETSSVPLAREAELLERAYAKLELGQLPDEETLMSLHKEVGLQLDATNELRIDRLWQTDSSKLKDAEVQELGNNSLKIGKKTKPTQFPERIQKHINRSQEIGVTEPVWKDGSLDFTWRPATNTGQIDIPEQSLKTFKGLRDEFFEKIENLPSGSVWELNPQFKDAKRRRIYAKLFEGDSRITRNADETLGWILKVP